MNIMWNQTCFHALVCIRRTSTKFRIKWTTLIIFHFCTAQRYRRDPYYTRSKVVGSYLYIRTAVVRSYYMGGLTIAQKAIKGSHM